LEIEVDNVTQAEQILAGRFAVMASDGFNIRVGYSDRHDAALINHMLVSGGIRVSRLGIVGNDLEKLFLQIISA
jgi:ABC-2 type transport system ATP-binding protein